MVSSLCMAATPTAAAQGIYGTALLNTGDRKAISHLVYMLKIIPYLRRFEHAFQKIVTDYNFITAITVLFFLPQQPHLCGSARTQKARDTSRAKTAGHYCAIPTAAPAGAVQRRLKKEAYGRLQTRRHSPAQTA